MVMQTPERREQSATREKSQPVGTSALMRAFTALETMANAAGSLTVDELSAATAIARPLTQRIVATFEQKGYLLVEGELITLGPRLIHLGATASLQLGSWAQPYLERLVRETGVTASLAVLDSDEVVYLGQAVSHHTLGMFADGGARVSPHSTAVGKAILGQLEDQRIRETLARSGMAAMTERTITTIDAFLAHTLVVRRQRYAFDDGEHDLGVRSIAVPIDRAPRVMALALSAPESRMSMSDAIGFLPALEEAAADYSAALNKHTATTDADDEAAERGPA